MRARQSPEPSPRAERNLSNPTWSAVVETVAAREGVHPTDLEPQLYEVVDPDALETLLATAATGQSSVTVAFEYAGYDVVVASDGTMTVE
jgi:hypothetical protein